MSEYTHIQRMSFNCDTDTLEKARKLSQQYHISIKGRRTIRRITLYENHSFDNSYELTHYFDSAESAESNNNLPETQKFYAELGNLVMGLQFWDYDEVIDDISYGSWSDWPE